MKWSSWEVDLAISSMSAIKGYELIEPIGEGAYGIVYRAWQPMIERRNISTGSE